MNHFVIGSHVIYLGKKFVITGFTTSQVILSGPERILPTSAQDNDQALIAESSGLTIRIDISCFERVTERVAA